MTIPQPSQLTATTALRPEQIEEFRASLLGALAQHEARIDTDVDPHDIAALVQRRSERARAEILGALARMEDGTYGSCVGCGEPIPEDRLAAVPHARHCAACAGIDVRR
jgi:DnaK suppressor protein